MPTARSSSRRRDREPGNLRSLTALRACASLLAAAALGCGSTPDPAGDRALRRELLDMVERDQAARVAWLKTRRESAKEEAEKVDRRNTARLREIIALHGWPGKTLVGEDGSQAAWLLVQHADEDRAFQKHCLELLRRAVDAGEASPANLAYLEDRLLVADGRMQRYGTQFMEEDGKMVPRPIEDEADVDRRRREVGLPPLAEYQESLREIYRGQ